MGERKGVNKYYPPDYDPTKGGLNAYHGTHALRERARKIHEGIIIIRFEMPYNIWCNGCGNHIGMGVRYNAQKRRMGSYYSTPIYKFRMKCHLCDQHFEIQTDPKNCDYQILSGCRRKEERWDTEKAGNVQTTHREVKEKLMTNAMFKLEHGSEDQVKVNKLAPTLTKLEEIRDDWYDDFAVNQMLRQKFRQEKKEITSQQKADDSFKEEHNLPDDFNLQNEASSDILLAKRVRFGEGDLRPDIARKKFRKSIKQSPVFDNKSKNKLNIRPSSNHSTSSLVLPTATNAKKCEILGVRIKSNKKEKQSPPTDNKELCILDNREYSPLNSKESCNSFKTSCTFNKNESPNFKNKDLPLPPNEEIKKLKPYVLVGYQSSSNSEDGID